jgi:hypothetical protein
VSFDGVSDVAVGPEMALDRRCHSPDSVPVSLLLRRRRIRVVGGRRSSPPALRALARGGAFRLLCCRSLEQRLQLLPHTPLLGGCGFRATAQQHGRSGKVLGRPSEGRRCVGVGICASIGTSIVVVLRHARKQCKCATTQLVSSWSTFASVVVLFQGSPCTGTSYIELQSPFPSWAWPCTSTPCAGCRSRGSASTPSSRCRRASSSSSWRLASVSSSSRARGWSLAPRWRGASSDSELLDAVATQTLHSRVGS